MARSPRGLLPPSAYGARLHNTIREGTRREVVLQCPGEKGADGSIRLLQRLNSLRLAMRKAKHPDADRYYEANFTRVKNLVYCFPTDSQFDSTLDKAGIPQAGFVPPEDPPPEDPIPSAYPDEDQDAALKKFLGK